MPLKLCDLRIVSPLLHQMPKTVLVFIVKCPDSAHEVWLNIISSWLHAKCFLIMHLPHHSL